MPQRPKLASLYLYRIFKYIQFKAINFQFCLTTALILMSPKLNKAFRPTNLILIFSKPHCSCQTKKTTTFEIMWSKDNIARLKSCFMS